MCLLMSEVIYTREMLATLLRDADYLAVLEIRAAIRSNRKLYTGRDYSFCIGLITAKLREISEKK